MAVDAIVRVSFESVVQANQGANRALVGVPQGDTGSGPFTKVATSAFSCTGGDLSAVTQAIAELGQVLASYGSNLDFVSISIVNRRNS